MPPSATETRRKLLDAATRAFADRGVAEASLIDITRQAGQRNRAALRYHFGSRDGVLCAVLERHVELLHRREGELLAIARAAPDDAVAPVVEAVVRPAVELAATGWRGRCALVILAQLVEEDQEALDPRVRDVLARTGGYEVYALLAERMAPVGDAVRAERFALVTSFILRAVADRARAEERPAPGRPQLPLDAFTDELVTLVTAMVSAPSDLTVPTP
ncbi:TetR family transcriptional regulator [Iamia majanohamensis]|uniref:TetR family transcriptional regulator n=1 Tax=Iamia majanohamensis TaxID=467976 RepID=A0AAF0BVG3_9ACTN|nr:TetR family transcriptional regulator [Iamia majanohamensis]WCO66998.1 TetR family transcriptional regulator [Iamia majanohamensis]